MPIAAAAPLIGGAISGGASIISGIMGSDATAKAARYQEIAQANALATQQQMFNTAEAKVQPFTDTGTGALNSLANLYGIPYSNPQGSSVGGQGVINSSMANFTNTPDYQFAFQQGLQALDRSAAAQGNLISGGQLKGAQEFGQGLASQQYSNYFNRLLSLAQIGGNAATGNLNSSIAAAGQIGGTQSSIGATQAAGTIGSTASLTGGINNLGSNINQSLLLNSFLNKGTAAAAPGAVSPLSSYQPAPTGIDPFPGGTFNPTG